MTKRTFKLDGSETEMSAPDGKPLLAKAVWEGNTLVVTIHFPENKARHQAGDLGDRR